MKKLIIHKAYILIIGILCSIGVFGQGTTERVHTLGLTLGFGQTFYEDGVYEKNPFFGVSGHFRLNEDLGLLADIGFAKGVTADYSIQDFVYEIQSNYTGGSGILTYHPEFLKGKSFEAWIGAGFMAMSVQKEFIQLSEFEEGQDEPIPEYEGFTHSAFVAACGISYQLSENLHAVAQVSSNYYSFKIGLQHRL